MLKEENIEKLLKLNKNFISLIISERADIIEANEVFKKQFSEENNLYNIFDKNTSLLVKNSFIDVKAFSKVQRRSLQIEIDNTNKEAELIISPFKIGNKTNYFVVIFWNSFTEHLVAYPTIDDKSLERKYKTILNRLDDSLPQTLIEKKNFQYELDIEKEPIFIKVDRNFVFVNNSFTELVRLPEDEIKQKKDDEIFEPNLAQKLEVAEEICYLTKNIIVIESTDYSPNDLQQKNRIVKYPILDFNDEVIATINFGSIDAKRNEAKIVEEISNKEKIAGKNNLNLATEKNESDVIKNTDSAVITYNPDNFKILEANHIAADLYGYSLDELLKMDITDLCSPDDMQKLLAIQEKEGETVEFKHIKKDGSIIEVVVTTNLLEVNNEKINKSFIKLKSKQNETNSDQTGETQAESETDITKESKDVLEKEISEKEIIENEINSKINTQTEIKQPRETSPFLSSLFHELLTPVNVILGFVQEIIDSIDKPTEEQEESAKIIKDNQQLLLQTMNTAVQYSQLVENKLPIRNEEFILNNYLLDLKDSVSRVAEKESTEVNFEKPEKEITLKNDRQKLLASVSYFLKFAIKLAKSKKINITVITENEKVYFALNDNEKNISQKLIDDLTEIFNTENPFDKKNFGISPITIRLSKKLNEITSAKVGVKQVNNSETIAISFPLSIEQKIEEEIVKGEEEILQTPYEKDEANKKDDKIEPEKVITQELDQIKETTSEEITSPVIEEEIIKDIEQEEEIATEEIVTGQVVINEIDEVIEDENKVSQLSCLLIEDSVDTQLLFQAQMKDFKLLKVVSGLTEALPLIKKYKFDLIYVDINLKGQYNGLDSLRIIRQFDNYEKTPIIAITAYPFEGDKEKFLKAGFTDYFRKPLLRENLVSSINALNIN